MSPSVSAPAAKPTLPRILIVDHFDSYTLNLLSLLSQIARSDAELAERVTVLPHTHHLLASQSSFVEHLLPYFDACILSPGPGSPSKVGDFDFGLEYLKQADVYRLPTLGVCLGHQGLAVAFGGKVKEAQSIQHGTQSTLRFSADQQPGGAGIFGGLQAGIQVTRYNSLTVDEESLPSCLEVTAFADDEPNSVARPGRQELIKSRQTSPDIVSSRRSIMGLCHKALPLWGVQFHPESIESQGGETLIRNFLKSAQAAEGRCISSSTNHIPFSIRSEGARYVASHLAGKIGAIKASQHPLRLLEHHFPIDPANTPDPESVFDDLFRGSSAASTNGCFWLDSARQGDPQSNNSYMGTPVFTLAYDRTASQVCLTENGTRQNLSKPGGSFWQYMDDLQKEVRQSVEPSSTEGDEKVFRTGFVGYWGYEMKDESLGLLPSETISRTTEASPAAEFGFCNALLRFDHQRSQWSASALLEADGHSEALEDKPILESLQKARKSQKLGMTRLEATQWIETVSFRLQCCREKTNHHCTPMMRLPPLRPLDDARDYQEKVEAARALIAQGESYELCLTTRFQGSLPAGSAEEHWQLYRSLRARNAAPYAAFLSFPQLSSSATGVSEPRSILSSSPERFLSKTRHGHVEMKPIKGTMSRAGYGPGEALVASKLGPAWAKAEDDRRRLRLEADPKERAENLMIVDLIRADLLSFCYPSTVKVPKLMQVESYTSVHQLVTTVCGQAKEDVGPVEALRRCFPPGSMTGAPKRRSVTLLERLEGKRRSDDLSPHHLSAPRSTTATPSQWETSHRARDIYSGALGWIGVDGAMDFSVVIRTAHCVGNKVTVGAGGAITYLSDKEKEWEEVLQKVRSVADVE